MIIDKKQLLENCLKESEYLTSIVDLMKNAIIENDAPKDLLLDALALIEEHLQDLNASLTVLTGKLDHILEKIESEDEQHGK